MMEDQSIIKEQFWFNLTANDLKKIMEINKSKMKLSEIGGIKGLLMLLHTDQNNGLRRDLEDLEQRAMHFGENYIHLPKGKRFVFYLLGEFADIFYILTILACLISAITTQMVQYVSKVKAFTATPNYAIHVGRFEDLAILVILFLRKLGATFCKYTTDQQFRRVKEFIKNEVYANVLRQGEVVHLMSRYMVTGDVVVLKPGDIVWADGLVIEGEFKVKEPPIQLFNQNLIPKNPKDPFIFNESEIMEGKGKMLVVCVGYNREEVKTIKHDHFKAANCKTRARIMKFMLLITYLSLTIIFGVTSSMLARYMAAVMDRPLVPTEIMIMNCIKVLIVNIVLLFTVTPSDLCNLAVFAMMHSVKCMLKENIIVKSLKTCEVLPSITSICTNKTGSITSNRMTVVESFIGGSFYVKDLYHKDLSKRLVEMLEDSIGINTNYGSNLMATKHFQVEAPIQVGNKTECALLGFLADQLKINYLVVRKRAPIDTIIKVFPIGPNRRIMTTLYSPHPDRYLVLTKGNAKDVIGRCTFTIDHNDDFVPLTDSNRRELEEIIYKMTNNSLRTLAMAIKEISLIDETEDKETLRLKRLIRSEKIPNDNLLAKNMVILAIFGLEDPLRPDVKQAVELCDLSGISVRMLTEDSLSNARSTALKSAIYKPWRNHVSLDRDQFNDLVYREDGETDQISLNIIMPYLKVFARISPEDKLIVLDGIKTLAIYEDVAEIIAVTGSTITDGPFLQIADVGFALGELGTETVKRSSNVILLADSFVGVLRSIMWGRNIDDTLLGVIQLRITYVFTVLCLLVISLVYSHNLILKPAQILFIHSIIELLLSYILVCQAPSKDIMSKPPYKPERPLVPRAISRNIIMQTVYQVGVIASFIFIGPSFLSLDDCKNSELGDPCKQFTMVFNVLFCMTLFNAINARKAQSKNMFRSLKRNGTFMSVWIISFLLQILVLRYGRMFFHTTPLFIEDWLWCAVFGVGSLLWQQVTTVVPVKLFLEFKMHVTWAKLEDLDYSVTESDQDLNSYFMDEGRERIDRLKEAEKAVNAAKKAVNLSKKLSDDLY